MLINFIELLDNNLLNAALERIMDCIMTAAEGMKQSTLRRVSKTVTHCQPWFDAECTSLRSKTLKTLRLFRNECSIESLSIYQNQKKIYRNLIKDKKFKYKQEQTVKLEKACDDKNPKEFWRFLKTQVKSTSVTITKNEWFEYFSSLFNETNGLNNEHEFLEEAETTNDTLDAHITAFEIRASIMDLKNKKSPGIDGLPSEFFKVAYEKIVPYLELLFNKFYDKSFFPEDWSTSIITPIPKAGDKNKPNNYRGISLQPVISKIYINILNKRLTKWSDENELIGEEQAGFRKSYSTIDNLFCLQTIVTKYLKSQGGRFYAVFVDFEKAFDRIDRNALWNKLQSLNISSKMSKTLRAIYASVKSCVKTQNGLTATFSCPKGVRQGCCISPILFSFFLNDLKAYVSEGSYGIDLDICKIFLLLFADDLVMFAESKIELQRLLNKLYAYCTQWNLKLNIDKTKVIVFRNGGYLRRYEKWFYGESQLQVTTYYKYLGLVVSSRLSWYMCQKTLSEQASKAIYGLKSNLNQFGTLSTKLLFKIFDTKILPILTYGAEIWFSHTASDIERIHHSFCKYILKVPKQCPNVFARGELGRCDIYTLRCVKLIKYWFRILEMSVNRYPNICYKLQLKWLNANKKTNCWAKDVKTLLEQTGFGHVWYNQGVGDTVLFFKAFTQRLFDIDIHAWRYDVQDMNKLRTYNLLKEDLVCEYYLNEIDINLYRKVMTQFRGGLLDLRAQTGRYEKISYEERICPLCNDGIENEYHFLLECCQYKLIRKLYIPKYYYTYPTLFKFKEILTKKNKTIILNVCKFIVAAMKQREVCLLANTS